MCGHRSVHPDGAREAKEQLGIESGGQIAGPAGTVHTWVAAHMSAMTEQKKVPDWLVLDARVAEVHPVVAHRLKPVFATITGVTEHEAVLSNGAVYPVPDLLRTQGNNVLVLLFESDPQVTRVRLAHALWEQRAAVVKKYETWSAEPTEPNTRALENAARLAAFSHRNFAGWLSAQAAKEAVGPV